ncbi:MAG: NUDIX domain-containing protein [Bacteroidales bacterium]|nr:NUDIX domain-containing protein [Candidatus Colimorpha onthohippi]
MIKLSHKSHTLTVAAQNCKISDAKITAALERLQAGKNGFVRCPLRQFWTICQERYQLVKAAGGIVTDNKGKKLIIYRYRQWDLPKGMVEPGEQLRQAATREVCEETGLNPNELLTDEVVAKTYHIHNRYGSWQLKQTTWYAMHTTTNTPDLSPQTTEDITHAEWCSPCKWRRRLWGSYATLRQLTFKK